MSAGASEQFCLLETMRLENGAIARIDRHLGRMRQSAEFFGYVWDERHIRTELAHAVCTHSRECWRVRLLLARDGVSTLMCTPHDNTSHGPWRVAFAATCIDDRSPFVFHKTTRRETYDAARRQLPNLDDVVLWNTRGEVTESTIANIVIEMNGTRVTPPLRCGLLGGVLRGELIERGELSEQVLMKDDVARAPRVWLINSLRGWIEATVA